MDAPLISTPPKEYHNNFVTNFQPELSCVADKQKYGLPKPYN